MELKQTYILIFILLFISCGSGTEVVNTPLPTVSSQPTKVNTDYFSFSIEISDGWTMILYDNDLKPGAEAFTDIDSRTDTVATFLRDTHGYFTIFAGTLTDDENLENYIRERRPEGEIEFDSETTEDGQIATMGVFYQEELGPRGGNVLDVYISLSVEVLWMRVELVGTSDEQEEIWNEFWDIVETIKVS